MAEQDVIAMNHRIAAGKEYISGLAKLGFQPQTAFWMLVGGPLGPRYELALISNWVDEVGSRAVYDLLFSAYDASATPKEVDPFTVTLFGPDTLVARELSGHMEAIRNGTYKGPREDMGLTFTSAPIMTIATWVLHYRPRKTQKFKEMSRFQSFERNVNGLAA